MPALFTLLALSPLFALGLAVAAPAPRAPVNPGELRLPPLPPHPAATYTLDIKFVDAAVVRWHPQAGRVDGHLPASELDNLSVRLRASGAHISPRVNLPAADLDTLAARAQARSGRTQPDLGGILQLRLPDLPAERAGQHLLHVAADFATDPAVEYVFLRATHQPPPGDLGSATPDFTSNQGYLEAGRGIDAYAAWAWGARGAGVRISDCEYGWNIAHEDLMDLGAAIEPGQTIPSWVAEYGWDDHGTAVLGELGGADNGYGITGIAPDASFALFPEWSEEEDERRATAIAAAAASSAPGDVVLLEMQYGLVCEGCYGPAELDPTVWTVVREAVDAGIVVVAAAGNGAQDLDGADYADWRSRGPSGAILVGAGTADTGHNALYFSTFGEAVRLQGWGELVFTTGYGWYDEIDGSRDQAYTDAFSGTSSASPIVAGAAALGQSVLLSSDLPPLSPEVLVDFLVETGSPQGSGGTIGPLPDLARFLARADGDADGVLHPDFGGDDCDDTEAAAAPGNAEVWYDGIDGDCAGDDDFDADGDGYVSGRGGGPDCDDTDPTIGDTGCEPSKPGTTPGGCSSRPGAALSAPALLALISLALVSVAARARRWDSGGAPA